MDPASEQWYYAKGGEQSGPVSADALKRLIADGTVQLGDLAWRDGMADWVAIRDLSELRVAGTSGGPSPAATPPAYSPAATPSAYGAAGAAVPQGPCPETWLWQSILATLCCCLPLGVVGIIFAAQVKSKWQAGDQSGALEASRKARTFFWWSFGVGLLANVLAFVLSFAAEMGGY